ncbi:MAG: hypothetical protein HQ572_02925 [Candidatus Omnitrophica bacterium]|nr:hypothetical protein [Candidatus Omnitrophota bacterium]
MKKLLSLLVAIVMVASTSGTALAAFTSDGTEAFTASSGSVGGTAGISEPFSATLKNLSDDATATDVAWTGVDAGDGWETADQYIEVTGFATYSNWGIQTYTDNEDVSASPQYTGTNNPAGLVRTDSTIYNLPVCWRTKAGYYDPVAATYSDPGSAAASSEELEIIQGRDGNYTVLYDGVTGHAPGGTDPYFPWFFILDKGTDDVDVTTTGDQAFDDYQVDATFIGSAGYHHAPGASEPLNFATPNHPQDKYYIYLGANFTLAIPAKTYTTNMLTVEMYHL